MQHHLGKSLLALVVFLFVHAPESGARTYGPIMEQPTHVVEEARIGIKITEDKSYSGTLTATLLECPGCSAKTYSFDSSTQLINQFGKALPITELKSWSGNRAMFTYRKKDGHVEKIQILP